MPKQNKLIIIIIIDSGHIIIIRRSSRPEVFSKKGVLKHFAKFTGKHLWQRIFFNKVAGLRPATFLEKRLAQMYSCEYCETFKNSYFCRTPAVAASGYGVSVI